jgi:hypothetical protein
LEGGGAAGRRVPHRVQAMFRQKMVVVCNYVGENVEENHIYPITFFKENEEYAPRKSTIQNQ